MLLITYDPLEVNLLTFRPSPLLHQRATSRNIYSSSFNPRTRFCIPALLKCFDMDILTRLNMA